MNLMYTTFNLFICYSFYALIIFIVKILFQFTFDDFCCMILECLIYSLLIFHCLLFTTIDYSCHHSVLKLFTGFATAAFIDWKLTVNNVMASVHAPATAKIHQVI